MKDGKMRVVVGIILVVLQLISIWGIQVGTTTLLDTDYAGIYASSMNLKQWAFGFRVGMVKMEAGLEEIWEDLIDTGGYYERAYTVEEYISGYYRYALKRGDTMAQVYLFLFDLNILIGFLLYGIVGILLIISGGRAGIRYPSKKAPLDDGQSAGGLRIASVVLIALFGILVPLLRWIQYDTLLNISRTELLLSAGLVCLGVFFLVYFGKKRSVLFSAALCFFAGGGIAEALDRGGTLLLADLNANFAVNLLSMLLWGSCGVIYLCCGIRMHLDHPREELKKWAITALVLVAVQAVIRPLLLLTLDYGLIALRALDPRGLAFAIPVLLYICKVRPQPEPEPEEQAPAALEPVDPGCCPVCRIPVNNIFGKCMKCGTVLPSPAPVPVDLSVETAQDPLPVAQELETPPVIESSITEEAPKASEAPICFCRTCGIRISEGCAFCHNCGTKV